MTAADARTTATQERCNFPGCDRPRVPPTPGAPPSLYCDRPDHHRKSAYEARIRAARQAEAARRGEEVVTEGPGEVTRDLWSLRETAGALISELRTSGDATQARFDAIVAVLDDIADAEKVEAELRAVRAEADARVAVAHADTERSRAEAAAARALAEESNTAATAATEALAAANTQVETLTPVWAPWSTPRPNSPGSWSTRPTPSTRPRPTSALPGPESPNSMPSCPRYKCPRTTSRVGAGTTSRVGGSAS